MQWRFAQLSDTPLLARMNAELIQDEGSPNAMAPAELEHRMQGWLSGDYTAVLFEDESGPLGYALYRASDEGGVHLRQFFIVRERRREGIGRMAFGMLLDEVLAPRTRIVVEVLTHNSAALSFWELLGFTEYARTLELRSPTARP